MLDHNLVANMVIARESEYYLRLKASYHKRTSSIVNIFGKNMIPTTLNCCNPLVIDFPLGTIVSLASYTGQGTALVRMPQPTESGFCFSSQRLSSLIILRVLLTGIVSLKNSKIQHCFAAFVVLSGCIDASDICCNLGTFCPKA